MVNSAGNTNTDINTWPGLCNDPALDPFHPDDISTVNKESFIVVAASDCSAGNCAADAKKADSNFGSWIELAAPGVNIQSTTIASVDASLYTLSNGTSAAAAFTTAGAAILISCGVTPDQVLNSLDLGATVAVTGDFNRINLYDSLAALNSLPTGLGLSVSTVNENTSGNTTVGNLSTTDTTNCDSHSYSITGGADAANFSIGAGGSSLVINDGTLNFESKSSYAVTVQSTDFYGASTSQAFIVNVVDLDEAPSISPQLRNIDENSANGTNVGAPIVASDQDAGASLAFAITAGNTGGAFAINNAGQISVANSAALDFETTPVFNLTVEVTDNGDSPPLSTSAAVTVNLNDVVEGPPAVPNPIIVFTGFVDYIDGLGNDYRRWEFDVTNSASFPDELFAVSATYPCLPNPVASRSRVIYYDAATGIPLNTFCALGESANMNGTWFGKPRPGGTGPSVPPPPAGVYMRIVDNSTTPATEYQSNVIVGLPNP